jgi:hypothetical protein
MGNRWSKDIVWVLYFGKNNSEGSDLDNISVAFYIDCWKY